MEGKRNLAHRMGRWSGTHPWTAILGWIAFVAVTVVISMQVTPNTLDENKAGVGESGRAAQAWTRGFDTGPVEANAEENVLVQTKSGPLSDATLAAVNKEVQARVGTMRVVKDMLPPRRSDDGRAALIGFKIRGEFDKAMNVVAPVEAAVTAIAAEAPEHPHRAVRRRVVREEVRRQAEGRLQEGRVHVDPDHARHPRDRVRRAARSRHPRAAGPLVRVLGHRPDRRHEPVLPDGREHLILMMLIGMAVGVDYSLFYLKRAREERARGRDKLAPSRQRPRRAAGPC